LTVDAAGHLTQVTDPTGAIWAMQYTDSGLLTAITHPNGHANTFEYDEAGRLLRDRDPEGGGWLLSSTDLDTGTRTEMISGEGRVRRFTVEHQSNGTRTYTDQAPDGTKTLRTYTAAGATTIAQSDGTVLFTREGPDPRFKMDAPVLAERRITLPSGLAFVQTTARTVALANPADALSLKTLTDTVTTNGRVERSAFDAVTSTWTYISRANRTITRTVDSQNRPLTQTVAGLEPVTTSYDSRGRPSVVLQGSGGDVRAASFAYHDASAGTQAGYLRSITDALGRQTTFTYDAVGRVTEQTQADGQVINYQYDVQGNLAALTRPGRSAHLFEYDGRNQATAYIPPDLAGIDTITRYRYNLDRQVTAVERPGGDTVSFDYDPGGRLARRTMLASLTDYGYDAATGQLATIDTTDGLGLSFEWDGFLPRATTWRGPVNGRVGYRFDTNLWPIEETVNGEVIAFDYDADGLLIRAGALSLTRDAGHGLVTGTTLDAVEETFAYNGFGEVIGRDITVLGTPSFQVDYRRDKLGRIAEQTETVAAASATFAYRYDEAGRLTDVQRNGVLIERYSYDANSNRATKTTSVGTTAYTYDAQDRLLEADGPGGTSTYAYSAAGDLRRKTGPTGTTEYDYDAAGNLRAVTLPDGTEIAYLIDGQDRRVGKRVNGVLEKGWLYRDQLNPVAELDGQGNVVARFVYADRPNVPAYLIKDDRTYRVVSDHLGSPRLVIDIATGEIAQRMDYDAFGNVVQDTNPGFQPFGFAGGLYDPDTGLVRFGARDYDSETGRWTAKDPSLFSGQDANLYRYAYGDPINLIDADGRLPSLPQGFVDFSAGLGDALLLGFGDDLRDALGIGGGVDPCSGAYKTGAAASFAVGASRLAYAAIAKGYSLAASSGAAASAFRQQLKAPFRLGIGKNWRPPNLANKTDAQLRSSAGRTNPGVNAAGLGATVGGASGIIGCGCD
jgi:RHS repeat-associated protein